LDAHLQALMLQVLLTAQSHWEYREQASVCREGERLLLAPSLAGFGNHTEKALSGQV